jgi:hypothetical protein
MKNFYAKYQNWIMWSGFIVVTVVCYYLTFRNLKPINIAENIYWLFVGFVASVIWLIIILSIEKKYLIRSSSKDNDFNRGVLLVVDHKKQTQEIRFGTIWLHKGIKVYLLAIPRSNIYEHFWLKASRNGMKGRFQITLRVCLNYPKNGIPFTLFELFTFATTNNDPRKFIVDYYERMLNRDVKIQATLAHTLDHPDEARTVIRNLLKTVVYPPPVSMITDVTFSISGFEAVWDDQ